MKNYVHRSLQALPFAAAALAACLSSPANAVLIEANANIVQSGNLPFLYTYNENNGLGRTFRTVTGERIRFSAQVYPSPDSDVHPVDIVGGNTFRSLNGNATTVEILTPSFTLPTFFIGTTSGIGGLPHEFTRIVARDALTQAHLDALDATPVQFRIRNALAPNGITEILLTGPDYDQNARPGFVNNITITGGALNPTFNWSLPDGASGSNALIQIRKVSGIVADGTFTSTFIANALLAPGATSYTVNNDDFTFVPGTTGLEIGAQYEAAVQLGIFNDLDPTNPFFDPGAPNLSTLRGRSQTFFEFTPLAASTPDGVAVFLPSVDADGVYHFNFEVTAETPVVIDPIIAIGYDYQIGAPGDPLFASVILPSISGDDGVYEIFLWNGTDFTTAGPLNAGDLYTFAGGVDRFRILGIDQAAMLDPGNATAFLTTLTFTGSGQFTGTMTALIVDTDAVPEPMTLSLFGAGLVGLVWARRRHRR